MSRSINKVTLVGTVGRDPDIQTTDEGVRVARLSLATNRRLVDGEDDRTDWHRIVLWKRQATFAEDYLRAGDRIYVEGSLEYESYERDGIVIPIAEVHVREVVMLNPIAGREAPSAPEEA